MGVSRDVFDKRIRQAVKASAIEVQAEAQTHHNYTSRTGDLTRSIDMRMLTDRSAVVYLDEGLADYGPFVHEGTRPHMIRPKNRKALRWVPTGGNSFLFAKNVLHPGNRMDPFLYRALDTKRPDIIKLFGQYTKLATKDICDAIEQKYSNGQACEIEFKF